MRRRRPPKAQRRAAARVAGPRPAPPRWVEVAALVAVVVVGAIPRLVIAFTDDGVSWPDEIYQSLEPAHRLVFGQGLLAWEFVEGGRSWIFPGLVAALMKAAAMVGLEGPRGHLAVEKVAFVVLAMATTVGTYRLGRALGASALAGVAGAAVFSLTAMPIYFGPRALSENASATAVAFGLALALPSEASVRGRIAGAALLALATAFRIQNAVFAAGLIAILWAQRRPAALTGAAVALGAGAAVYGLVDLVTWGSPFRSAIRNIQANLALSSDPNATAATWYFPPPAFYAETLLSSMGLAGVLALALAVLAARERLAVAAVAAAYVALHALVPHKELRFMIPVLPVIAALASVGVDITARYAARQRWPSLAPALVLVAACAVSGAGFASLRFPDVGVLQAYDLFDESGTPVAKAPASAYDWPGSVNRLLIAARSVPDLCGLKVEAVREAYQGGYTYLDRAVPLYRYGGPARAAGHFNYAIALRSRAGTGEVRATDGDMVLVRVRDGCVPDPAFSDRL